jgi:hypothetical protein
MKQRKEAALRWLRLSLAATLAVPTLIFGYIALTAYRTAFNLADERIDRTLAVSAEQALLSPPLEAAQTDVKRYLVAVREMLEGIESDPALRGQLVERLADDLQFFGGQRQRKN